MTSPKTPERLALRVGEVAKRLGVDDDPPPRSPAILVYALVSLVAFGAGLVVGFGVGRL